MFPCALYLYLMMREEGGLKRGKRKPAPEPDAAVIKADVKRSAKTEHSPNAYFHALVCGNAHAIDLTTVRQRDMFRVQPKR